MPLVPGIPLPHQLDAVYRHMLRLPRENRFILLDRAPPCAGLRVGQLAVVEAAGVDVVLDAGQLRREHRADRPLVRWRQDHRVRVAALERLGVLQGWPTVLVDEVELDLEPDRAAVGIEARLPQHAREDIEARAHLGAVALPVLTAENPGGDFLSHAVSRLPGNRG